MRILDRYVIRQLLMPFGIGLLVFTFLIIIPELMRYVLEGTLELSSAVSRVVPLEAAAINLVLDDLEAFRDDVRSVILP